MINLNLITKSVKIRNNIRYILNNISLDIEFGEYIAIVGKSGAGKSTLLNILSGIDKQTYGDYFFNHQKIATNKQRNELIRNECSMIMQNFALVENMTVFQNLLLRKNDKVRAQALLQQFEIDSIKNQKIKNCSGGEKQRTAIARALISDCCVLLADEPTGALDSDSSKQIREILKRLNDSGITIILVTHDYEFSLDAKRIITLQDGRIVSDEINH
ncbi:ABC transporter ATP-binding protein [Anaerorhabdus sp.]|uniref:ABC transporter ATP-binding protein n=1 Tax=Anaerorhabdus sp. TaxID=1872524 RepID=UPI003A87EE90